MPAIAVQWVGVEIVLAVARQARERAVEQALLEHIGIASIEIEMQHPLSPEDQRHRGTGLGIGRVVGQVVVFGEAFIGGSRAEAGFSSMPAFSAFPGMNTDSRANPARTATRSGLATGPVGSDSRSPGMIAAGLRFSF